MDRCQYLKQRMSQPGFIDLKHRYEDLDAADAALELTIPQGIVEAHAKYISSDPAAGAALTDAPSAVRITFAETVDTAGSGIAVYDVSMKQVSAGASTVAVFRRQGIARADVE